MHFQSYMVKYYYTVKNRNSLYIKELRFCYLLFIFFSIVIQDDVNILCILPQRFLCFLKISSQNYLFIFSLVVFIEETSIARRLLHFVSNILYFSSFIYPVLKSNSNQYPVSFASLRAI